MLISLKEDDRPTADFVKQLRTKFAARSFQGRPSLSCRPISWSQILNLGLPAPIDIRVVGKDQQANYAYATKLLKRVRDVPGIADARIQQVFNYPQLNVAVDRTLANQVGLTQRDVGRQSARDALRQRPGEAELLAESRRTASPIRSSRRCRSTESTRCRTLRIFRSSRPK